MLSWEWGPGVVTASPFQKPSLTMEILLRHKKEHIWVSSNKMDEPRAYYTEWIQFSSVAQSCRVIFVTSRLFGPHGLQHTRLPCPSPTPGAYSNSCPLSWWCHPTILSSTVPFSSCLQSCPASGSFQMSQFFILGGQSIEVSASALSFQYYSGLISFRMNWLDLLAVQGTFKSLLQHRSSKASILQCSAFFIVQLSHP